MRNFSGRRTAAFLVLLTASSAANALPERISKSIEDRIAAGTYPVLVIGVIDDGKSEVAAFGKLPSGAAPDGDSVFEIGSVTKTFTATLLADAVQSGRVQLDEPVARLLPDFTIPKRNGKEITLVDLATQHSGLPRLPSNMSPADPTNPYADYNGAKLKAFLTGYELPRDPGASYEYSNLGVGLLGYALAASAHTTYGALVDEKILRPLGMTSSGTQFSDTMRAHLAPGFDAGGKPANNWYIDALAGAGSLRSTANDMLRYLKANMAPNIDKSPLAQAMTLAHQPRSDAGPADRIGLVWMTQKTSEGDIIWHNGMTGGYASYLGFSADGRHGVIILTNSATTVDDLGLATLVADAPLAPAHKQIALPAAALEDYAGTYKIAEGFLLKIFHGDDQLFAQATGQSAIPVYASAPDEFFAKIAGISMSFHRDAGGKVTGVTLHQNGDREAPRLTAAELPPEPKEVALDGATLQSYAGKYQLTPGTVFDVTVKDNQLFAQLSGQSAFPVYASAKDKFFYKVVPAQLDFERDAAGKIVALTLHQNGRDQRAPREP